MPENTQNHRVLSRSGARELSAVEVEQVSAGFKLTHVCTFDFTTCIADQDCETIPQCP